MIALLALLLAMARTIVVQAPHEPLRLEIADTFEAREYGLMRRTQLAPKSGMIFVFSSDSPQRFWMKNTLIPLDMIFVRADGTITSIASKVPASTLATPDERVATRDGFGKYVIELAGGEAARAGLRVGLHLELPALDPAE